MKKLTRSELIQIINHAAAESGCPQDWTVAMIEGVANPSVLYVARGCFTATTPGGDDCGCPLTLAGIFPGRLNEFDGANLVIDEFFMAFDDLTEDPEATGFDARLIQVID
jgi:hypothetical protein